MSSRLTRAEINQKSDQKAGRKVKGFNMLTSEINRVNDLSTRLKTSGANAVAEAALLTGTFLNGVEDTFARIERFNEAYDHEQRYKDGKISELLEDKETVEELILLNALYETYYTIFCQLPQESAIYQEFLKMVGRYRLNRHGSGSTFSGSSILNYYNILGYNGYSKEALKRECEAAARRLSPNGR